MSRETAATGRRPNVVLILADDLGYSDLGCYGGEINTPVLDRLGRTGVRMTQFYTTPRCAPSRASLLTGLHPHRTGVGDLNSDDRPWGYPGALDERFATLAEVLRTAGYATSLSGKWHLSNSITEPDASWPTRRGFDEFYGIIGGAANYFGPRGHAPADVPLFWEHIGNCAVRLGRWKLVREAQQPWELYDVTVDRVEEVNLATRHPDVVTALAAEWQAWAERTNVIPFDSIAQHYQRDGRYVPRDRSRDR